MGPVDQAARSPETGVAFARLYPSGIETVVAFAGAGRALTETVVAFAGEKWAFLVQFSGAEVMPVSEVPCWGRAVVLLVSTSPRCLASCAKNFALLGLMCARARKSSPCALTMAQNWRFLACWASFSRKSRWRGGAGRVFSRQPTLCRSWMQRRALQAGCRWGICSIRNWQPACRRRVTPLMTPFPPIGDGETVMFDVCPAVSHAIPLWLFQDLNWHRWNCNDSGGC